MLRMEEDRIGNVSIKYNDSRKEIWTRAMKYLLTNLQWLIQMSAVKDEIEQQNQKNS